MRRDLCAALGLTLASHATMDVYDASPRGAAPITILNRR
jgi:hypothetical protein